MKTFTLGPLPCRNSESFSKISKPKEHYNQKKTTVVVHRHVEGENNGKCYKIKGPKTPFILRHLEKTFTLQRRENSEERVELRNQLEETPDPSTEPVVRRNKREHSVDSEDEGDANQPSTSSAAASGSSSIKKRSRL